jgi:hypothetical protein
MRLDRFGPPRQRQRKVRRPDDKAEGRAIYGSRPFKIADRRWIREKTRAWKRSVRAIRTETGAADYCRVDESLGQDRGPKRSGKERGRAET